MLGPDGSWPGERSPRPSRSSCSALRTIPPRVVACLVAGASWTVVLTLYVSAQVALPDWVRGRGLAIFLTAVFGAMTAGSAVWGQSPPSRAAGGPFRRRGGARARHSPDLAWKLQTGPGLDLAPAMHWRAPVVRRSRGRGPVLVTVDTASTRRSRAFLAAIAEFGTSENATGFAWGVFEDHARALHETFLMNPGSTHASYERVTNADRLLEEHVGGFLTASPVISHLVASERRRRSWKRRTREPLQASEVAAPWRMGAPAPGGAGECVFQGRALPKRRQIANVASSMPAGLRKGTN